MIGTNSITLNNYGKIQKYKKKHDVIFQSTGVGQACHKHGGQRFDSFLEDLTPWTPQSDLRANNCQKRPLYPILYVKRFASQTRGTSVRLTTLILFKASP